ncbi:hypothetical protein pb186bvf_020458 [Paramecium bursaria]
MESNYIQNNTNELKGLQGDMTGKHDNMAISKKQQFAILENCINNENGRNYDYTLKQQQNLLDIYIAYYLFRNLGRIIIYDPQQSNQNKFHIFLNVYYCYITMIYLNMIFKINLYF